MKTFFGILAYEYRMSITRKAVLIVTGIFIAIFIFILLSGNVTITDTDLNLWEDAGSIVMGLNIFFPVVAGIIASDRAVRDNKLNVRELLRVTKLKNATYIAGKYLGVVLSLVTMQFSIVLIYGLTTVIFYGFSPMYLLYLLAASSLINIPGLFFITAFSLACPLIMPVRVYQILFTGYWYWGNFLNPEFIPTIANTLLHAAGKFAASAYFNFNFGSGTVPISKANANIAIMFLCAAAALVVMERYITWRENAN